MAIQLSTCIGCGFTSHSTFQSISTVNLYWLWVHKSFNVSTYQAYISVSVFIRPYRIIEFKAQLKFRYQVRPLGFISVIAVGTQVMTINTTARMATKNINCQLVLAVGSQAIQRFNFISTVNLYWLWVHKPFNV
jgi:hypothetical protein